MATRCVQCTRNSLLPPLCRTMLFWVVIGCSSVGKPCRTPPLISPPALLALVIDLHLPLINVVIQTQTQMLWMSMLNPVRLRPRKVSLFHPFLDLRTHILPAPARSCVCDEPLVCRCPSTSGSQLSTAFMTPLTLLTLLRDILLGHHVTRSRISVFHADLSTIQRSLDLHAVPHASMTLVQCRRALLHHIASGACTDYQVDAVSSPRPDRTACRALSQDFKCAAECPKLF